MSATLSRPVFGGLLAVLYRVRSGFISNRVRQNSDFSEFPRTTRNVCLPKSDQEIMYDKTKTLVGKTPLRNGHGTKGVDSVDNSFKNEYIFY